jgi:hypothetical protein
MIVRSCANAPLLKQLSAFRRDQQQLLQRTEEMGQEELLRVIHMLMDKEGACTLHTLTIILTAS